jgi:hypothetical protein
MYKGCEKIDPENIAIDTKILLNITTPTLLR